MSSIPSDIPDVGATSQKLSQNPAFDPLRAGLSTEDYFVWSRVDGATSVKDLLLMTGFTIEHGVAIVRRLRGLGAVLLPGENTATMAGRAAPAGSGPVPRAATQPVTVRPREPTPPTVPRIAQPRPPSQPLPTVPRAASPAVAAIAPEPGAPPPLTLDEPTADERIALGEKNVALTPEERTRVLAMQRRTRIGDPWFVLGVNRGADKKALKRSYFKLSKDFHPDRFYGKKLGSFAVRLNEVFESIAHAYAELTEDRTEERAPDVGSMQQAQAQTPAEYAVELFDRACAQEMAGDAAGALRVFDAAIRVDGQPRYLKRAATCALGAQQPRVAEDYAKKAAALEPNDPSTQRLLARAFRAVGKPSLAEEVLLMALQLKNENDALGRELRADLTDLRRALAREKGAQDR
jgi:DnaJ domain